MTQRRDGLPSPDYVLSSIKVMAQSHSLKIYRITQLTRGNAELLRKTYNLLVEEWNSEINGHHNRYGHHHNEYTISQYYGMRDAIGKAMADSEDRTFRRSQQRDKPIAAAPRKRPAPQPVKHCKTCTCGSTTRKRASR